MKAIIIARVSTEEQKKQDKVIFIRSVFSERFVGINRIGVPSPLFENAVFAIHI